MSVQQLTPLELQVHHAITLLTLQEYFLRLAGHAEPKARNEEQEQKLLKKLEEKQDRFFDQYSKPQSRFSVPQTSPQEYGQTLLTE
jgi:hypothetical protein